MKKKLIIISFLFLWLGIENSFAQDRKTFLGAGYGIETNVGFHGLQWTLERVLFQKNRFSVLGSYNFFHSIDLPDRRYDFAKQYFHAHQFDLEAQYVFNKSENGNGFRVHGGLVLAPTRYQYVWFFEMTGGVVRNVRLETQPFEIQRGIKLGVGYQFSAGRSPIVLDLSMRSTTLFPREPNMVHLGVKVGF
ncbi:MAG: hypothetical protein ACK4GN_00610 [Runella sp.]